MQGVLNLKGDRDGNMGTDLVRAMRTGKGVTRAGGDEVGNRQPGYMDEYALAGLLVRVNVVYVSFLIQFTSSIAPTIPDIAHNKQRNMGCSIIHRRNTVIRYSVVLACLYPYFYVNIMTHPYELTVPQPLVSLLALFSKLVRDQ